MAGHVPLAAFKYLLDLALGEGQLPDELVSLVDFEYPYEAEDGVDAVLGAAAATAAADLGADLDLELAPVTVLDG